MMVLLIGDVVVCASNVCFLIQRNLIALKKSYLILNEQEVLVK